MPHKSRFSPEEKELIVQSYNNGAKGLRCILEEYGISWAALRECKILYEKNGIEGLTPKAQNKHYPLEVKMWAAREYLNGKASYRELMRKYNVSSRSVVRGWVKQYNMVDIRRCERWCALPCRQRQL